MSSFDTTLNNLGINRTTSTPTPSPSASGQLGQSDFLKLMTAQLKNQDPFAPVDNTQMVAQMAQFSSVAGISEMNSTLKAISDKLAGTSQSDALAYVGRTVLTEGNVAFGRTAGGIAGAIELDGDATQVNISIQSADGQVLKNMQLGPQSKGTVEFDWDGKTDAGADAGNGPFKVVVTAAQNNSAVTSRTLVWAPVAAVSMPASGTPVLTLPGIGQVPITAVRQIG
ncbi:flagellar hook capping FlgD N-terminal domain-containing protein [Sphingomonas sp. So64.6b]|uniref:flagellar hook assembly protein FlgD n=1 Tax=Sphingomonas sp. So64.6b TaxID=2997354 RepID=UPI0031F6096B